MSEAEKITINLGPVDLGQVDLLVRAGFYSNRTDFVRTAIRNQLAVHADAVRDGLAAVSSAARRTFLAVRVPRGTPRGGKSLPRGSGDLPGLFFGKAAETPPPGVSGSSDERPVAERWLVHGAGHAWSGGSPHYSYTAP